MDGGPLTAIGGLALVFNLVGLYAFTGVALCVFGYIALTLALSSGAGRGLRNRESAESGTMALVLSWVVALVGGALVGGLHWVQYAHAAYAVLGVYAFAVLIWLVGRAYSALWSCLFPLVGAAMLAVVMQSGPPPGADDMEQKESWTPVNITAVDEAGTPVEGVTIHLDLVHFWQGDPEWDGEREWWSKDETKINGTARMAIHEDVRFKRLVIGARREPFTGGFNEPTTIGGYTGYSEARLTTVLPTHKVPYAFQLVLTRRPHPDSALVAVELSAPSLTAADSRSLKLVLTPEPNLSPREGRDALKDDDLRSALVRDVYLSGSQSVVLKLGRELTARPLTLHILARDSSRYDDSYLVLETKSVEPISLGDDRTLSPFVLADRAPATGSQPIADRVDDADPR